jgi:hypothetical protein
MGVIFMKKIRMFLKWGHRVWAISTKWVPACQAAEKGPMKKKIIILI